MTGTKKYKAETEMWRNFTVSPDSRFATRI